MTATQHAGPASPAEATHHWRRISVDTDRADRAAAERGVRAAYRAAGLAEPSAVVWFDSPLQATLAALLLTGAAERLRGCPAWAQTEPLLEQVEARLAEHGVAPQAAQAGASVREAVRTRPWEQARGRTHERLGAFGWAELWSLTGGELWPAGQALADRIRAAVAERLHGAGRLASAEEDLKEAGEHELAEELRERTAAAVSAIRLALLDAVLGQHDAAWLAAFDAAGELEAGLAPLAELARSAGWWWPYERVALLAERPAELHRDEAGRLDRADGPALAYPDGFALHAWHGMPVPADFLAGLGGLTPERIREEENAELRRVMLEHYGYDRYLADSGAEPLHRDPTGVLWRIQLPDDEPVVMVEVVNSTPEPDGTLRTYWLRVPPTIRTARAGVAWTFGLTEEQYHPQRET
ncbi:DUF6745 domain-containing protein [Kitasatospora azatica]|uniref:DUF6745 domain-containing protein n=1 Tax=Kitasatospora azatica TaxID=58347 RepID=UPI00068F8D7F|nr:hypothetical protein [Kitasatospora azatica]